MKERTPWLCRLRLHRWYDSGSSIATWRACRRCGRLTKPQPWVVPEARK